MSSCLQPARLGWSLLPDSTCTGSSLAGHPGGFLRSRVETRRAPCQRGADGGSIAPHFRVNFTSQHYPSLPGCAVSLPTDAITALTLLGSCVLSPSVSSVKNVRAVQSKHNTPRRSLPFSHPDTRCLAEGRRWVCPAKRSKDQVLRTCPLSGHVVLSFYRASRSTVQRCRRMSRNNHSHSNFVRLGAWFLTGRAASAGDRFPLKRNRGGLTCNGVR